MAADGADIVLVDLDAEKVKAAAAELNGTPVACDLSDLDAVDELDPAVDVLVNNAGIQHVAPIQDFPPSASR